MINTFEILDGYLNQYENFKVDLEYSDISIDNFIASILKFVIHIFKPKNIIELGTLYGRSAILMSSFSSEVIIHSVENNQKNFKIAEQNISKYNLQDRIKLYFGNCSEILNLESIKNLQADMIFIDANKARYCDYLDWSCKFLSKNGIIIADNIFIHRVLEKYQDKNCQIYKNMESFLEKIYDKSLFNVLTIPYKRDGLSIIIKK